MDPTDLHRASSGYAKEECRMKPALAIGTVVEVDGRPAVLLEPGWEEGETVVIRSAASASHATATQEVDPHVLQWTRDVLRKIEACQMADQPPRYTDWRGILAEVANLLTTFWMASRIGPTGGGASVVRGKVTGGSWWGSEGREICIDIDPDYNEKPPWKFMEDVEVRAAGESTNVGADPTPTAADDALMALEQQVASQTAIIQDYHERLILLQRENIEMARQLNVKPGLGSPKGRGADFVIVDDVVREIYRDPSVFVRYFGARIAETVVESAEDIAQILGVDLNDVPPEDEEPDFIEMGLEEAIRYCFARCWQIRFWTRQGGAEVVVVALSREREIAHVAVTPPDLEVAFQALASDLHELENGALEDGDDDVL